MMHFKGMRKTMCKWVVFHLWRNLIYIYKVLKEPKLTDVNTKIIFL